MSEKSPSRTSDLDSNSQETAFEEVRGEPGRSIGPVNGSRRRLCPVRNHVILNRARISELELLNQLLGARFHRLFSAQHIAALHG